MRWARWVIGVALGVILLAVAAVVVVTLFVDPNRFKGRIEAMVRETTGRPFEIRGDLDIMWFPWLAVRAGPSQLGNPAGMGGPPLAQWQSARVGARLIPLIRGQLQISRIRLEGPRISLRRTRDGRANWDGLLRASGPPRGGRRGSLQIAGIEIRNGAFEYVDERSQTRLSLANWRLDVDGWRTGRPFSVRTSFLFQNGPRSAARIPVALNVPKMQLVSSASPSFSIAEFGLSLADAKFEGSVNLKSATPLRADGGLSMQAASLRKFLHDLGIGGPRPRDATMLGPFKMKAQWAANGGAVTVKPIDMSIDQTRFKGELARSAGATPVWSFYLKGDRIVLGRYTDIEDTGPEPFELPTAALQALRVQGVLSFDEAQLADARMKNVRLRVELADGQLHEP